MGITELAFVYQDTAFGREFLADVTNAMAAAKQPVPKTFKLDAPGAQVADVVGKAVAAKPNAVLLGTAGDITATLVNEFKKVSPSTPLAATSVALSVRSCQPPLPNWVRITPLTSVKPSSSLVLSALFSSASSPLRE